MARDPFSDSSAIIAKAALRLDITRVEGKEVELSVVICAPGMPELNLSRNVLREGDSLTIQDITINLSINVNN